MSAIQKHSNAAMKKLFPDCPDEALAHIDSSGLVYYTEDSSGKRTYGIPRGVLSVDSLPLRSMTFSSPSKTEQEHHDDCDIKSILKKYNVSPNYIPEDVQIPLEYFRDLSIRPKSIIEATQAIEEAQKMFMELPAELRREFNDDPAKLHSFAREENAPEKLYDLFTKHFGRSEGGQKPSGTEASEAAPAPSETSKK